MAIRSQAIVLFYLLIFCYTYIHQGLGANQNSRLDLLHSFFVSRTFQINAYQENTCDKSVTNGRYYSDKAPGITFLSLPAFAVSVGLLKTVGIHLDSPKGWLISSWITTAGSVGLITALGGVAMFALLCQLVGRRFAFITSLVVFLGSSPFPYATMLFSHAAVVGLICIALWAIADQQFFLRLAPNIESQKTTLTGGSNVTKRCILAGLCCGFAIASEYTSATAAAGVLTLASMTDIKRSLIIAIAAIPPLLLIPINNWACFGSPLAFGYHHLAAEGFQAMNQGLFGITFPPSTDAAFLILVSPERGLFFWTPFYFMAFFGAPRLLKNAAKFFWVTYFVVVIHIICISGYYMPSGGGALGPRHLAPILPFLTILTAFGLRRWNWIGIVLGYLSILLTGTATLINAMTPDGLPNPLVNLYLPRLLDGAFVHTLWSPNREHSYIAGGLALLVMLGTYTWAVLYNHPTEMSPIVKMPAQKDKSSEMEKETPP